MPDKDEGATPAEGTPGPDPLKDLEASVKAERDRADSLEALLADQKRRSAGKDTKITELSDTVKAAQQTIAELTGQKDGEIADWQRKYQQVLDAAQQLQAGLKEGNDRYNALITEREGLQQKIARLEAVAKSGLRPELQGFVPEGDEAALETAIGALKQAEEAIAAQVKADMAQFVTLPSGPGPGGGPGSKEIDLKARLKSESLQDLLEKAGDLAKEVQAAGLPTDDGLSWMDRTKLMPED